MQMLRTLFAPKKPSRTIVSVTARTLNNDERRDNRLDGNGWRRTIFTYNDGSSREGAIVLTVSRATALALTKI